MSNTDRQRGFARRAMWASVVIGVLGFWFFTVRGDPVAGLVLGLLLTGGGYWEYKRRLRDLEMADDSTEDPFERRERRR